MKLSDFELIPFDDWCYLAEPLTKTGNSIIFQPYDDLYMQFRESSPERIWSFKIRGETEYIINGEPGHLDPKSETLGYCLESSVRNLERNVIAVYQFKLRCPHCKAFGMIKEFPDDYFTQCFFCEGKRKFLVKHPTSDQIDKYED